VGTVPELRRTKRRFNCLLLRLSVSLSLPLSLSVQSRRLSARGQLSRGGQRDGNKIKSGRSWASERNGRTMSTMGTMGVRVTAVGRTSALTFGHATQPETVFGRASEHCAWSRSPHWAGLLAGLRMITLRRRISGLFQLERPQIWRPFRRPLGAAASWPTRTHRHAHRRTDTRTDRQTHEH